MGRSGARSGWNIGKRRASGRSWGVTLLELLVVLAVLTVLTAVGVPSFGAFTASMRLTSAANGLLGDLHLTRAEAMKRRQRVVICKSPDGVACTDAGGWDQGWIVFVDNNSDGWRSPSEPLLQRQQALGTTLRLAGNSTVSRYVAYAPDGATRLVGGGFQAGTLTVCQEGGGATTARQIIISAGGRPRVQKVQLAACAS